MYQAAVFWQILSEIPERSYVSKAVREKYREWKEGEEEKNIHAHAHPRHSSSTLLIAAHGALWHPTTHGGSMTAALSLSRTAVDNPAEKNGVAGNKRGVLIEAGGPKSMDI